ncbi:unnamed protein product [Didymodactylos carnosus]|uniref:Uncharacterized protein n=1 Tax=Didymodactylos carnosus TaxID=1234261 RepID=A0A8S2FKM7_9BILA|nr:unnamed protein product [Didymodactylos carnosus]CAF4288117.1 unnamed protein product [Didymodactylos carnosus]
MNGSVSKNSSIYRLFKKRCQSGVTDYRPDGEPQLLEVKYIDGKTLKDDDAIFRVETAKRLIKAKTFSSSFSKINRLGISTNGLLNRHHQQLSSTRELNKIDTDSSSRFNIKSTTTRLTRLVEPTSSGTYDLQNGSFSKRNGVVRRQFDRIRTFVSKMAIVDEQQQSPCLERKNVSRPRQHKTFADIFNEKFKR